MAEEEYPELFRRLCAAVLEEIKEVGQRAAERLEELRTRFPFLVGGASQLNDPALQGDLDWPVGTCDAMVPKGSAERPGQGPKPPLERQEQTGVADPADEPTSPR
jgi:hypothetical protein